MGARLRLKSPTHVGEGTPLLGGPVLSRSELLRGLLLGGAGLGPSVLLGCGGRVEWGYSGSGGPGVWASLSEDYVMCDGRQQSPVDLTGYTLGRRSPLAFSYGTPGRVRNDGAFVHVDYPGGNSLVSDGRSYDLKSAHVHAPSEHAVDGEAFAAELHLVHADAEGHFAVVGLLFADGEPSPLIQVMLDAAPAVPGETARDGVAIDPGAYVPDDPSYFRYDGSKTTPPCDEDVAWHVMREIRTILRSPDRRTADACGRADQPPAPARQRPADHARRRDIHRAGVSVGDSPPGRAGPRRDSSVAWLRSQSPRVVGPARRVGRTLLNHARPCRR